MSFYRDEIARLNKALYPHDDLTKQIIQSKFFIDKHFSGNAKKLFALLGAATLGVPATTLAVGATLLFKLMTNKKAQQAIRQAVKSRSNPTAFLSALENIESHLDEVPEKEQLKGGWTFEN